MTDKQQNIDMQTMKALSCDAISSTTHAPPPSPSVTAVRRRDLKPSLMSHISGVHRLSGGVDVSRSVSPLQTGTDSATHLPKYGVDCPDRILLDEVHSMTGHLPAVSN